jgi:transposase
MARKQEYKVALTDSERDHLKNLVSSGVANARKLTRARILLRSDEGWIDKEIAQALDVGTATVGRIRQKYVEEGIDVALNRQPSSREYVRKIDGKTEAHLIALVCGDAPEGYAKWSLRLLADRFVQLEQVEIEAVSHETVRQTLKKTTLSPGKTNNG